MTGAAECGGTATLIAGSGNLFRDFMKDGRYLLPAKGVGTIALNGDDTIGTYHCPHIPIENGFGDDPKAHYDEEETKQGKDNPEDGEDGLEGVRQWHRDREM